MAEVKKAPKQRIPAFAGMTEAIYSSFTNFCPLQTG